MVVFSSITVDSIGASRRDRSAGRDPTVGSWLARRRAESRRRKPPASSSPRPAAAGRRRTGRRRSGIASQLLDLLRPDPASVVGFGQQARSRRPATISATPPPRTPTTGRRAAMASTTTRPNDSLSAGCTSTSISDMISGRIGNRSRPSGTDRRGPAARSARAIRRCRGRRAPRRLATDRGHRCAIRSAGCGSTSDAASMNRACFFERLVRLPTMPTTIRPSVGSGAARLKASRDRCRWARFPAGRSGSQSRISSALACELATSFEQCCAM